MNPILFSRFVRIYFNHSAEIKVEAKQEVLNYIDSFHMYPNYSTSRYWFVK